jgi:hypothetical protein
MANERSGYASLFIEILFEWEEHQNPIDRATYLGDPITSPSPDGRAHQVNDGDSSKPKSTLQTKIEVRGINTQKEIRRVGAEITE